MAKQKQRIAAFTLIELLVVIGVIAILAGILLGALPAARNKAVRGAVRADLRAVETAIESFKAKHNFYPPDNPINPSRPPLYYELTGTTNQVVGTAVQYHSLASPADAPLAQAAVKSLFGMDGFINTGAAGDEDTVLNFHKSLLPRQVREIPAAGGLPAYKVLVAPRFGPDKQPAIWQYNKTNPTNNVGAYDLWAEIELGGNRVIVGNWEK